ncbi:restriction endonuclease subunit S [Veillonella nakazawae]|uniref:restriction endonuclease subunit S n=1 Tax=Veillonella nakazawae TaxID=2682456 RepID=UPI0039925D90
MSGAKKRVPKRRFKEFLNAGEWEQRKLSELATMNARIGWQNLRTSEFLDSGDYLLITGTDFDNGRVKYSTCHYVEKKRFDQDTKIQLSTGSILITKDGTLGKVALVEELPKPATLNAGVFNVRVKDDAVLSYKYLYHYLKAPFLMKYVTANATGGTIKHLNQSILVDFPIPITEKPEQDRIAKLLDSLESSITLHQRKLDKLQATKKALLQEMFPEEGQDKPKRRFKGFTDAWEQRKLGDTNTFFTDGNYGNDYPTANEMSDSVNGVPFLRGSNLNNGAINLVDVNYITKQKHNLLTSGHTKFDDIIIAVRGSLGNCGYVAKQFIDININSQLAIIRTDKNELSGLFLIEYLLSSLGKKEINRNITGTALKQLPINSLKMINIKYPSINEQEKISILLSKLNASITLHQRKLDKLKNLKQAYLNEMFV